MSLVLLTGWRTPSEPPVPPTPTLVAPPSLMVEVSFDGNPVPADAYTPADTPAWVDITSYVRASPGISIRRGRQRQLDRTEAGTASMVLDNRTRVFDPTWAASPYYPNVIPMRPIRISVGFTSTEEAFAVRSSTLRGGAMLRAGDYSLPLFRGYVVSWAQDWPAHGADAVVTVTAVDAFGPMSMMGTGYVWARGGEPTGLRIDALLTGSGAAGVWWPDRWIDPYTTGEDKALPAPLYVGQYTPPTSYTWQPILGDLQEVEASEGGMLFVSRDGTITFYGHLRRAEAVPEGHVWGVDGDPFSDIAVDYDESLIYNAIRVSAPDLEDAFAEDTDSQVAYFRRELAVSTNLYPDPAFTEALADALLERYAQPRYEVREMTIHRSPDWDKLLRRDLWDPVHVAVLTPAGNLLQQDCLIEGIAITAQGLSSWSVTWRLSTP